MLISAMQHNFQLSLIPWKSETGSRVCHNLMVLSALDTVALPNSIGGVLINIDLDRLASLAFKNSSSTLYMVYEDRIIASSDAACFFVDLSAVPALEKAHRSQIVSSDGYHVHALVNPTYGYTLYSLQEHAVHAGDGGRLPPGLRYVRQAGFLSLHLQHAVLAA